MEQEILTFADVYNEPAARAQAEKEKAGAFGWMALAKVWDRPKETDISLVSSEKRYEPFWRVRAARHTRFQVKTDYTLQAVSPHALKVSLLDRDLEFRPGGQLLVSALEHCEKHTELSEFFDGLLKHKGAKTPSEYVAAYQERASPYLDGSGLNLLPPDITAALIVQKVKARLMEPVAAHVILDDELLIGGLTLYYRPVYAFEFAWRDKRGVVEIDALTGSVNREGSMLSSMARQMVTREVLFDVGAELASSLVPGGGVVVKLVGAATKPVPLP